MRILCAPTTFEFDHNSADLNVALYAQAPSPDFGCIGEPVSRTIRRRKLSPPPRGWDFLSIALSCFAADLAGHRARSADGWTREFDLCVTVNDVAFWNSVKDELESTLQFLTTDIWTFEFIEGGYHPSPPSGALKQKGDCVALLSGGLDSFVGAIDLSADGYSPVTISHISRGDHDKQESFPKLIGTGLQSALFGHGGKVPDGESPASQRSRSIVFIGYAVLVATCLETWSTQTGTNCFVSENGFISLNPPLTDMRVGSLSTRTTHPTYFRKLQSIFDQAGFNLKIENRYALKTKGEMLIECQDQALLRKLAHTSTSCGRFLHYNYKHCGRCIPCLVRRAAFLRWGHNDQTTYIFDNLGINDDAHSRFDDVRAAAIASLAEEEVGTERWAGATLASAGIADPSDHIGMLHRGLIEIRSLLAAYGVL
ncbi:Qat anti-phage system QueC-like protein QatC [Hyphococcus sp.]|uniref:Qat anti-phage system QueC-like protein QatC n=1 Tax=Hyphococcus sp. TaxID=2038636 RepID=UPI0035C6B0B7